MKEIYSKNITYMNCSVSLFTNDVNLYTEFEKEYKDYFCFKPLLKKVKNVKIKVLEDEGLYYKYFDYIRKNSKIKNNVYFNIKRENIIIIDKINSEIDVIYDKYNDSKLQHVEEIILGIFGKMFEDDGYYFVHASCVSKNEKGILILGAKHTGKTSLLLEFLNDSFDFVTNTQLGIKMVNGKLVAISIPSRIGIRIESLFSRFIDRATNKKHKKYKRI